MKNKSTITITTIIAVLLVTLIVLLIVYQPPNYEEGELGIYHGDELAISYNIEKFVEQNEIISISAVLDTSTSSANNVVFSGVMLTDILDAKGLSSSGTVTAYASDGFVSSYANAQLPYLAIVYMLDGVQLTADSEFKGPFAIIDTSSMYSQYWCQCVVNIKI